MADDDKTRMQNALAAVRNGNAAERVSNTIQGALQGAAKPTSLERAATGITASDAPIGLGDVKAPVTPVNRAGISENRSTANDGNLSIGEIRPPITPRAPVSQSREITNTGNPAIGDIKPPMTPTSPSNNGRAIR